MKMRDKARRIRNAMVSNNRILAALARRRPHVTSSSVAASTRSLYAVLMIGMFFALMILVQMLSLVSNSDADGPDGLPSNDLGWMSAAVGHHQNEDNNNEDSFGHGNYDQDHEELPTASASDHSSNFLSRFLGKAADPSDKHGSRPDHLAKQLDAALSAATVATYRPTSSVDINGNSKESATITLDTATADSSTRDSIGSSLSATVSSLNLTQFTLKDDWQLVNGSKDKFFVYSAYYDGRSAKYRYVRVIAAARTRTADKCVCRLHYENGLEDITVSSMNKAIRENWNLKYSAYFVLCLLGQHPIPDQVTILVKTNANYPSNRLTVHKHPLAIRARQHGHGTHHPPPIQFEPLLSNNSFAVCVKPLHYDYNKVLRLVEFLELNRILGVSHFVLYNHTIGHEANCLLEEYVDRGLVTVLPWHLDIRSQKEIRTEGLFAALNDCLYRTMYTFKYVLMIDFDEFIVPHATPDLMSLMAKLGSLNNNAVRAGAYSFQNAFFYLQWPDDEAMTSTTGHSSPLTNMLAGPNTTSLTDDYKLLTLMKTRRKSKLHIHKQRSKCIVRPENVIEMGNHFVWEFIAGKSMINVAPKFAFLHHYRICEFGGDDCVRQGSLVDRRIPDAWMANLTTSVTSSLMAWHDQCHARWYQANGVANSTER